MNLSEWCQTHSLKEFMELIEYRSIDPKEKGMNEHVREDQEFLDVAAQPVGDDAVFVQDDSDYPVDPLDQPRFDGVAVDLETIPSQD